MTDMITTVCIAMLIVLVAMMTDLASGLYKARLRGEVRTSWALKRTVSKFIMYEGSMIIAAGVDMLIHYSHILRLLRLEVMCGVPAVTCLVGVFLLAVEFISIRETADTKTRKQMHDAAELLAELLKDDVLRDAVTKMAGHAGRDGDGDGDGNGKSAEN